MFENIRHYEYTCCPPDAGIENLEGEKCGDYKDPFESPLSKLPWGIIIGVILGVLVLAVCCCVGFCCFLCYACCGKRKSNQNQCTNNSHLQQQQDHMQQPVAVGAPVQNYSMIYNNQQQMQQQQMQQLQMQQQQMQQQQMQQQQQQLRDFGHFQATAPRPLAQGQLVTTMATYDPATAGSCFGNPEPQVMQYGGRGSGGSSMMPTGLPITIQLAESGPTQVPVT